MRQCHELKKLYSHHILNLLKDVFVVKFSLPLKGILSKKDSSFHNYSTVYQVIGVLDSRIKFVQNLMTLLLNLKNPCCEHALFGFIQTNANSPVIILYN